MDEHEFSRLVDEMFMIFRTAAPSQASRAAIYDRVDHIPDIAMQDIFENIETQCDNVPRNLAKAILAGWMTWKSIHPERITRQETDCPECGGSGHIIGKSRGCTHVARCAKCENWVGRSGDGVPIMSTRDMKALGYEIVPYWVGKLPSKDRMLKYMGKKLVDKLLSKYGASIRPEPAYREHDERPRYRQ